MPFACHVQQQQQLQHQQACFTSAIKGAPRGDKAVAVMFGADLSEQMHKGSCSVITPTHKKIRLIRLWEIVAFPYICEKISHKCMGNFLKNIREMFS